MKKGQFPHVEKAMQYINDVLSGAVPVCKYVKLAAQRHLNDLEKQSDPNYLYYFDAAKAERVCRFVEMMIHTKGKWARTRIVLEPWQCFATAIPFGWMKRANKKRRFREVYIEVPRKNGKSAWAAALGNYMLAADGEMGSEVYCGASKEKQAWEIFGPARLMCQWNEDYRKAFNITVGAKNISILSNGSKFEPLIGNPGDGASPHFAEIDEFHEHRGPELYDTMTTGMGAREQAMCWITTTAGFNTSGPCYTKRSNVIKTLEGVLDNPELFAVIYTIDENDDWQDFDVWKKANPNYGVSLFEDYLRSKYREAMQSAEKQNVNRCKHLNVWSNAAVGWINMAKWEACADPSLKMEQFVGYPCWVGVDLANKIDLTAMMFLFRVPSSSEFAEFLKGEYALFGKYYLPEETIERPENAHYRAWRDQGYLTQTPGARTDYLYLERDLKRVAGVFDADMQDATDQKPQPYIVKELTYDPREAEYLMQNIRAWANFPCIEIQQSPAHISEPMKEFEALYLSGKLRHDGNPLLKWQASNVIRRESRNKSYYPAKERDENKIDGIVAAIMALSRAMTNEDHTSVYETRGPLVLSWGSHV